MVTAEEIKWLIDSNKIATKDSSKPTVKKYHYADDSIYTTDSRNSADTKAWLMAYSLWWRSFTRLCLQRC